jgi:hypothetical protein
LEFRTDDSPIVGNSIVILELISTAASARQSSSNPVSSGHCSKTVIFGISAGDFRESDGPSGRFRHPETVLIGTKARQLRAFLD